LSELTPEQIQSIDTITRSILIQQIPAITVCVAGLIWALTQIRRKAARALVVSIALSLYVAMQLGGIYLNEESIKHALTHDPTISDRFIFVYGRLLFSVGTSTVLVLLAAAALWPSKVQKQ